MPGLQHRTHITSQAAPYLTGIVALETVVTASGTWIYAGSRALGGIAGLTVQDGATAMLAGAWAIPARGASFLLADLGWIDVMGQPRLTVTDTGGAMGGTRVESFAIAPTGTLSGAVALTELGGAAVSQVAILTSVMAPGGGTDSLLVAGAGAQPGLDLIRLGPTGSATLVQQVADTAKTALSDSADLITLRSGASRFVINAAQGDGGLSSFAVDADGQLHLTDTIGVKEGLWLSGLAALAGVSAHGTDYVVAAATLSSSLSLVRVNPLGVMFVADHRVDDLTTRFHRPVDVAAFDIGARGFVVAGGADDGISLFAIMPDGRLLQHQTLAQGAGQVLGNVTALAAVTLATEVQVVVAGSGSGGISQFALPIATIADPLRGTDAADVLTGGPVDDLIWAGAGNDTLKGGDGADILAGSAGADRLTGGEGADIFVFDAGPDRDQIQDFQAGLDTIDLSRWGMIYSPADLLIQTRANGADVSWSGNSLRILSVDDSPLDALRLADSFLF